MVILAQGLVFIVLCLITVIVWRGGCRTGNMMAAGGLFILAAMLAVFSAAPELWELRLALEGVNPEWRFRYEAWLAAFLTVWKAQEWAYG